MPDESPEEREVVEIVRAVEAGTDGIAVPEELLVEPDQKAPPKAAPPVARSLYAQILAMSVAEKIKLALRGNKDARTILVRDANTPGLATAGSGDVLTGIVAAFLSKGLDAQLATAAAAVAQARAASLADKPRGLVASDVIEALPHVFERD